MLDQDKIIRCPILTYTSVVPKDDGDTNFRTTAQKLETDIETLLTNGFTPISLREAYGSNTLDNPCVEPVCIVFLGGYENNYTVAFPILKRYNIPVSIFVATDFVGVREYPSVKGYSHILTGNRHRKCVTAVWLKYFRCGICLTVGNQSMNLPKRFH